MGGENRQHVIFAVSDGSGGTAQRVIQAALTQFESAITVQRFREVRSDNEIREIVRQAADANALIVHTLVSHHLRELMFKEGRRYHVHTLDLMGPLLDRLSELLETSPLAQPGLYLGRGEEYARRIEAMDFAFRHDDGKHMDELEHAEIVLVGPSRTGKTPLSVYLAYRGWLVGNVPIIMGMEPSPILFRLPSERVIGLTVRPDRLSLLRRSRTTRLGGSPEEYADPVHVREEVRYARQIFRRGNWRVVDMTAKPMEEASAEVVMLIGSHSEKDEE